jgi:FKBP-type peptidyl-prolyl cis-trans isomerase (trigger factor)
MKVTAGQLLDGRQTLSISATSAEVDDAFAYLTAKCATENEIDIGQSLDLEFDLRAKVGGDFLAAYLNTQVPIFLAAKAVGVAKLSTILNPEISGRVQQLQKGRALEFKASVLIKPQFELSSYEPVTIEVPEVEVSDEEVEAQIYMLAERFATYATGEDGQADKSQKTIPAINDAWVSENVPGAETVDDLRELVRANGMLYKQQEALEYTSFAATSELAKRLEGEIAPEIYELTRNDLLSALQRNLDAQGRTMEEFVKAQGGEKAFVSATLTQTNTVLRQGFALDALARHLNMRLTSDDIDLAFTNMAPGYEDMARLEFERTGRMYVMEEAAMRIKATRYLVEHAIKEG